MENKKFRNKKTGEIVTQFRISDINNFEELAFPEKIKEG